MGFIASKAGLAMARVLVRAAKIDNRLKIGDKMVTRCINQDAPIILIVAANDGTCAAHVAYATERNLPVVLLPSREEVGDLVGCSAVVACVMSFEGHESLLAKLLG